MLLEIEIIFLYKNSSDDSLCKLKIHLGKEKTNIGKNLFSRVF
jgi:hypothetical protein